MIVSWPVRALLVSLLWLALLASIAACERPLPAAPPVVSDEEALRSLGAMLFADRRLSADGTVACSGCHQPERAFTDGRPRAMGLDGGELPRNTPTLFGLADAEVFGWADPTRTITDAVTLPLCSGVELGVCDDGSLALSRLRADPVIAARARQAFGEELRFAHLAPALIAYLRTLPSPETPYDRWLAGDQRALSPLASEGQRLFVEVGCVACHSGPRLGGGRSYHNLGLYRGDRLPADQLGLAASTHDPADVGRFRVPSLRHVAQTAPYFHDGSAPTLADVLAVYRHGGRVVASGPLAGDGRANPNRSPAIVPIALRPADVDALIAFLESL